MESSLYNSNRDYWPHVDRAINCGAHLETFRVRPCTVPCQLEPSPTFPRGSSQVATQNQNLLRARRSEYSRVSDFSTILDRSGAHVRRIAHHNACSGSLSIIVLIVRGIWTAFNESKLKGLPRRTRKSPVATLRRGSLTRALSYVCLLARLNLDMSLFKGKMYHPRWLRAVFITPRRRDVGVLDRGLMLYPSLTD